MLIAEFVTQARWEDFPADVTNKVKWALLDTLGVALAGSRSRRAQLIRQLTMTFPMEPREATVWGTTDKTSCLWAALANGVASSTLDADDGHRGATGHPGGIVIPAALAAAERADASGRTVLEAVVVGYEIGLRAGMYFNRHPDQVLHASGTGGAMGAAAAAAKALGLNTEACFSALGITEVTAPIAMGIGHLKLGMLSEIKEGMGWGSFTGLTAASLAEQGMIGTFSLPDTADHDGILNHDLGRDYEISKIYFKAYPACRWSHHAIERVLEARREHDIKPEMIANIRIGSHKRACYLDIKRPQTTVEAGFSIPFLIGTALIHGQIGPEEISDDRLLDPTVLALADKVTIERDAEADARYPQKSLARVEITTTDGRKVEFPPEGWVRGDAQNPFTPEEMEQKFRTYAGICLNEEMRTQLREAVMELESLVSAADLTRFLAVEPA